MPKNFEILQMTQRQVLVSLWIIILSSMFACSRQVSEDQTSRVQKITEDNLPEVKVSATESISSQQGNSQTRLFSGMITSEALQTRTPTQTRTMTSTQLSVPTVSFTRIPSDTPTPFSSPSPTQTSTDTPTVTWTLLPSPTATFTSSPTTPPSQTPISQLGVIEGGISQNTNPLKDNVTLVLEDQAFNVIREVTFLGGEYIFNNLPASPEGYNVLFSQERNPQFGIDEVASWVWIGPIPVQDGDVIRLAEMEIGLLGLHQTNPPPDTFMNLSAISPQNPLIFEWTPYPSATQYWLDLRFGSTLQLVWQSNFLDTNAISFDGILANGEPLHPGTYWWQVSARSEDMLMTITGPLAGFTINP